MYLRRQRATHILFVALALIAAVICLLIGWRPWVVGSDSYYYEGFFLRLVRGEVGGRYEIGFYYFSWLVSKLTSDVRIYFSLICGLFLILYFAFVANLAVCEGRRKEIAGWLFCVIGMLAWSSWFQVAVTNGLRQGLSLVSSYVAISYLLRRKYIAFVAFSAIAVSFHKSGILVVASSLLLLTPSWVARSAVVVSCALYFFGLSERLLYPVVEGLGLQDAFGLDRHQGAVDAWFGFSWVVFGYTIFWWVVLFCYDLVSRFDIGLFRSEAMLNIYSVLLLPYFLFGFGAYSNRYAYMAWLLLPLIQTRILWALPISVNGKIVFSIAIGVVGIPYLVYRVYS